MASFRSVAPLKAAFVIMLKLDIVVGGMSKSLRGARMEIDHRFDEKLSEADMPSIFGADDTLDSDWPEGADVQWNGIGHAAEIADSDENEDVEGIESAEGVEGDVHTIEHLTRISKIVDANNDGVLSPQELEVFADSLRDKKKWENSRSALVALDADGDGQVTHEEMKNRISTSAKSNNTQRFFCC